MRNASLIPHKGRPSIVYLDSAKSVIRTAIGLLRHREEGVGQGERRPSRLASERAVWRGDLVDHSGHRRNDEQIVGIGVAAWTLGARTADA